MICRGASLCYIAVVVLILACGCDAPVQRHVDKNRKSQDNWVTTTGRGNYNWNVVGARFDTIPPVEDVYLVGVDREKVRANIPPLLTSGPPPIERSPGVSDRVYGLLNALVVTHEQDQVRFEKTLADGAEVTSLAISPDETRLLTAGTDLVEWTFQDGTSKKIAQLSGTAKAIFYSGDSKCVYVETNATLSKLRLEDGVVLEEFKLPGEQIEVVKKAALDDVLVVLASDRTLLLLDSELKRISVYQDRQISNKSIAISPDGTMVGYNSKSGATVWTPSDSEAIKKINHDGYDSENSKVTILNNRGYWYYLNHVMVGDLTELAGIGSVEGSVQQLNTTVDQIIPAVYETGFQSFLVGGVKQQRDGSVSYRFFDVMPTTAMASMPSVTGERVPELVATSTDTTVIAWKDQNVLRVMERLRFVDQSGMFTAWNIMNPVSRLEFEQVDEMLNAMRSTARLRNNRLGEDLYYITIEHLALQLARDALSTPDKARQEAFDAWYRAGGVNAKLCFAMVQFNQAWMARGSGFSSTVSQEGWDTFTDRINIALPVMSELLQEKDLPAAAYCYAARLYRDSRDSDLDLESIIRRAVEQYPTFARFYSVIAFQMVPRWGGEPGSGARFVEEAMSLLPDKDAKRLYAEVMIDLQDSLGLSEVETEIGMNLSRLNGTVSAMVEAGFADRDACELLMANLTLNNTPAGVQDLLDYHYLNFEVLGSSAYQNGIDQRLQNYYRDSQQAVLDSGSYLLGF